VSRAARLGVVAALAAAAIAGAAPAAWGHATLVTEAPSAVRVAPHAPGSVALTFSEAVEPRFTIVSVTDSNGRQLARGAPSRSAADRRTIDRRVGRLKPGWYLVYWRVISADGHPVRGAYTFAVGPGPGSPPQFASPSLRETAATPGLLAARWGVFLTIMAALGLVLFRCVIARPLGAAAAPALRRVTLAAAVALTAALVLVPVYVLLTTASFSTLSALDVGALVPLARVSSFGRAISDLELLLALFAVAAGVAVWLDRPERARRSVVELLALGCAAACAAAILFVPGLAGHAAQTSPRALALGLDWVHLAAGSIWVGGLIGMLVLWAAAGRSVAATVLPRFSRVALGAVLALVATGTAAAIPHLPTFAALWQTGYGRSILVKLGLLAGALALVAASRRGARLAIVRRTVAGEVALVAGAVFAAGVLTSLPPPANALGKVGDALAHVGPGPVSRSVVQGATRAHVTLTPNRVVSPTRFGVRLTRRGAPLTGAEVVARFDMLDMDMGQRAYALSETAPGTYQRSAQALLMVGLWGVTFDVRPRLGAPFSLLLVDEAGG
jgi:copper transport protein